jgi:hypothetical protein
MRLRVNLTLYSALAAAGCFSKPTFSGDRDASNDATGILTKDAESASPRNELWLTSDVAVTATTALARSDSVELRAGDLPLIASGWFQEPRTGHPQALVFYPRSPAQSECYEAKTSGAGLQRCD